MAGIYERAAQWGIQTEYYDALGHRRSLDPDTLSRLVNVLSQGEEPERRLLPRTVVARRPRPARVQVEAPAGTRVHWQVQADSVIAQGEGAAPTIELPGDLPIGTSTLHLIVALPDGEQRQDATLLVSPQQAYQGTENAPRRSWALAVQLYGVRSQRNWGHGDFTDLARLIDLAAERGAAGIGLNPLHALFDDRADEASPYSPNSRLFLNPLYIDVEAIAEFPGLSAAARTEVARLRGTDLVDYKAVTEIKLTALRLAYENFRAQGSPERRRAFEKFQGESAPVLRRFACFEFLRRRFGIPWWEWPAEWQNADDEALARLYAEDAAGIGFYEYVQWIAHEQLHACSERIRQLGMPIGLYLDVAVGVNPSGFDAWSEREAVLQDVEVGAPPDALNTQGQNWGLAGLNPAGLENRQFKPFRRMLQASMRYAGAIRLDHVLALKRLFLIPRGLRPDQGGYVHFPFEALLAVTAQESMANRCIVIGEDLGTVPENFRETLSDSGIWSYQVMLFERDEKGAFIPPERYRDNAVVTFTTHDLQTFQGWALHHDLEVKRKLGIDPGETDEQRQQAREALTAALRQPPSVTAVAQYLARTPARLLLVTMEDALGVLDQPNIPGTVDEHPNWRRRLPVNLEDLGHEQGLSAVAEVLVAAGRGLRHE